MTNVSKTHNVNPIATLINAAMTDASKEGNRQAALVAAMFESEATYSLPYCLKVVGKKGKDRTEEIDKLLSNVSDDFKGAVDMLAALTEERKAEKSRDKNNMSKRDYQIDALTRKIKAARQMFERALVTVIGLRESGATKVKVTNVGTGSIKVYRPDPAEDADEGDTIVQALSANALQREGQAVVNAKLGKTTGESKAKNPATVGMISAIDAVDRYLEIASKRENDPIIAITDFNDETESKLEQLFARLFKLKFQDDTGSIDYGFVREYTIEYGKVA